MRSAWSAWGRVTPCWISCAPRWPRRTSNWATEPKLTPCTRLGWPGVRAGWGWMAWADCYEHMGEKADQDRARQILERGLAVPGVKPRRMLAARLAGDPADDIDFDDFDEETEDGFDYR